MNNLNYISPINQLGYGLVGLNILKELDKAYEVSLWPINPTGINAHPREHELIKRCMGNTNKFNKFATCLRIWHQFDMALRVGKGTFIGLPIFELNKFNDVEKHHLSNLDAIAVASRWAAEIVQDQVPSVPVIIAPFGVDRTIFNPQVVPLISREGNATVFINIGKWEVRKGHDILVEAFNKAFTEEDNVRLVMCCYNPFLLTSEHDGNQEWVDMYQKSRLGGKIDIVSGRLQTQYEVAAVINYADCGVFPARAEGWNMELLECMSCGKNVITTNVSAHTEYCNIYNSLLIDIDAMEDAYDGVWFHGEGEWAELGDAQVEQLVEHMRTIHRLKQSGELKENATGIETANRLTWENNVKCLASHF